MSSSLCKEGRDGLVGEVGRGGLRMRDLQIRDMGHKMEEVAAEIQEPQRKEGARRAAARSVIWQTQTAPGLRQGLRNQLDCSSQESAASA